MADGRGMARVGHVGHLAKVRRHLSRVGTSEGHLLGMHRGPCLNRYIFNCAELNLIANVSNRFQFSQLLFRNFTSLEMVPQLETIALKGFVLVRHEN